MKGNTHSKLTIAPEIPSGVLFRLRRPRVRDESSLR